MCLCKTMFLKTLCVGETFVRNALKKCDPQTAIVKIKKTCQGGRKLSADFDQRAHQKFSYCGVTFYEGTK